MIRLLGALILVTIFVIAACSSGGGDGDNPRDDVGDSIVTGGNGIPEVEGKVVTNESGLQIIDVQVGEGDAVQPGEIVSVDYTGYLEDGTVFATTRDRGEPIAFSLNRVMQGWQEGIPGMRVGGERRLLVPAELAAGTFGFGPTAPPGVTVIFDIKLLEIIR